VKNLQSPAVNNGDCKLQ